MSIADAQERSITFCSDFFQDFGPRAFWEVRNNLDSGISSNDRTTGWCKPGMSFEFFVVAGEIVLHEITQLDIIGQSAGLSRRPIRFDEQDP